MGLLDNDGYGACDIILMLDELHKRGYEQLRILPGLSPSGFYWRWRIYPKALLGNDKYLERNLNLPSSITSGCPYGSTGKEASCNDYKELADEFISLYQNVIEAGKRPDAEYIRWFQQIVNKAKENIVPLAYYDYFNAKEWEFSDREDLSFPPF